MGYRRITFVENFGEAKVVVILLFLHIGVDIKHNVTHKFVYRMWAILFFIIFIGFGLWLYVGPGDNHTDE